MPLMNSRVKFERRLRAAACLLAAVALHACASAPRLTAEDADLIIRNVTVISAERTAPLEGATVVIHEGRIVAVTAEAVDGVARSEIDGEGRYLIPGLIDSHVHLYHATGLRRRYTQDFEALYAAYMAQLPRSFLYYGYTTVIELNADADANARFLAAPEHPDLAHCGQGLILHNGFMASELPSGRVAEVYPNYLHDHHNAAPPPDGATAADHTPEAVVARIEAGGGVCVKMYFEEALWAPADERPTYALPSIEIMRDVAEAARARGMPLILHATSAAGFNAGLDAGVDAFAHGPWDWPDVAFDDPNIPAEIAPLNERLAQTGVHVQPTMRTLRNTASLFDPTSLSDPALAYVLPPAYLVYLETEAQAQRDVFLRMFGSTLAQDAGPDEIARLQSAFNARYERLIGMMDNAGVPLLFGTDTAVGGFGWGNPPGLNGYWEMQGWARGGVSLRSLFEAATLRNAEAFGLDDEIGTVEPGKRANLLLLNANPLLDVAAYDSITDVIQGGARIERETLSADRR